MDFKLIYVYYLGSLLRPSRSSYLSGEWSPMTGIPLVYALVLVSLAQ